jgi:DNA recombination-dependent growth factor C
MTLQPHQQRVVTERDELKSKTKALTGVNPGEFDGSMAIVIGEFRPLIAELVSALGGFPQSQPA